MKEIRIGRVLLHGHNRDGLYPIPSHCLSFHKFWGLIAFLGVQTSTLVWHQRLGHPTMSTVHQVIHKNKLPISDLNNKQTFCHSCQLAKCKCLPFSNLDRESSLPLQLVHSDVWQSPVVSFSGCCYYVIFIDDYSRFSWLFPLKSKSDVYTFFIKFKCMVKNLFSTKIKSLQSDGGGEYSSTHFKFFLA